MERSKSGFYNTKNLRFKFTFQKFFNIYVILGSVAALISTGLAMMMGVFYGVLGDFGKTCNVVYIVS